MTKKWWPIRKQKMNLLSLSLLNSNRFEAAFWIEFGKVLASERGELMARIVDRISINNAKRLPEKIVGKLRGSSRVTIKIVRRRKKQIEMFTFGQSIRSS